VHYTDIAPVSKQMTIVMGLSVVGLMAFGLVVSVYKNVLFDRQLDLMAERNMQLSQDIVAGYSEIEYFNSPRFKDKFAKESLGLLGEREKVVILPAKPKESVFDSKVGLTPEERQALYEERLRNIRVIDHWRMFLFRRGDIDALRRL
jgi:hypothetical protein